jgi:nucleotide-binding universal stress UspA family protein
MPNSSSPYVIVVAVDYSEAGDLAFERALELASEKSSAEVHVLHVLTVYQSGSSTDPTTISWSGSLPTLAEAAVTLKSYIEKATIAFRANHPGANLGFFRLRAHQRADVPSEQVAQLAADVEADLVVVGTHGRRGFERILLGSVAEATVRLAPCQVLVVRPKAPPPAVPVIEPPCPRCVEARKATSGREFWCEQHREHHGQRHTYHQSDRAGADANMPLVMHS